MKFTMLAIVAVVISCRVETPSVESPRAVTTGKTTTNSPEDKREKFGREVAAMLLDTDLYELKATLTLAVKNPNPDDESPIAFLTVEHPAAPGPHNLDGTLHADIEALKKIFPTSKKITVEGERVFIGSPEVLILGHRHGEVLYVPVKLFARQFRAYVDIGSTLATHGTVWTRETIEFMRRSRLNQAGGLLYSWAEGITGPVDVREQPAQ